MTKILNKGKSGHWKLGIIVSYETLIKNTYCNIHSKTVGVGKTGGIYSYSSLYLSKWNSWHQTERNHTAGHIGSQNTKLSGFSLWFWIPSCRERVRTESLHVGKKKKRKHILRWRVWLLIGVPWKLVYFRLQNCLSLQPWSLFSQLIIVRL